MAIAKGCQVSDFASLMLVNSVLVQRIIRSRITAVLMRRETLMVLCAGSDTHSYHYRIEWTVEAIAEGHCKSKVDQKAPII
jgi:hypothetical protein